MTWSERIKLAWTIFKREALPLYAWTFIFIGIGVVLVVAMVLGVLDQLRWAFPQAFGGPLSNFSMLLSALGSVVGTLLLLLVVGWLIGSAFYTGLFNLTAKTVGHNSDQTDQRYYKNSCSDENVQQEFFLY